MATKNPPKNSPNFECLYCDYNTSKNNDYNRHILTNKHINNVSATDGNILSHKTCSYKCELCDKNYNDRTGLWRHKKKCNSIKQHKDEEKEEPTDKELVMMLLKQNNELIKEQSDIKQIILEIVKNGTTNTTNNVVTHTNSHNKAFNLNFFLNETCKDAMNITDFVEFWIEIPELPFKYHIYNS